MPKSASKERGCIGNFSAFSSLPLLLIPQFATSTPINAIFAQKGGGWIDRGPILTVVLGAILTVAFQGLFQSRLECDNDVCSCCQARR